jgi:mono/diheme cytochrome c family protein
MNGLPPSVRRAFAVASVVFLAVLAISPAKNALRPYRSFQRRFRELGMSRARSLKEARTYERQPIAIRQIWLPNFGNRVDRCTTCHMGEADPRMEGAPEPFGRHPAVPHAPADFDRFGCTACHGGQGRATDEADAHGTAPDAGPPMTPSADIEAGCGRCHLSDAVDQAPELSRGRAVMARSGCYACHAVPGHESFRSEAPALSTLPLKTGAGWLRQWLRDPKSVDPNATMPNFHLKDSEITALANYLFGRPVPEDLARRIREAGAEPPGDPGRGRTLFSESRCISCHTVEGKGNGSGPELSRIGSQATRGWLLAFVRDPQAFHPNTRMPRFNFTPEESRDLVAYLDSEMRDFNAPADLLEPLRVNQTIAQQGAKVFQHFGCFACHSEAARPGAEKFGPDLAGVGDKKPASLDFGRRSDLPRELPAWLSAKLAAPRSFADGLRMPSFALSREDRRAVVTALLSLGSDPVPEAWRPKTPPRPSLVPGGSVGALIRRYRCLSCHEIGDRGGDLATAPLSYEGSKVRREWLVGYLMKPYAMRPLLPERMPRLRMTPEEAGALADAIESFYVDPSIPEDPFAGRPASDADAVEGQRIYVTLGCRSCHILGDSGGYYGPPLTDSPRRLKAGWIFAWLKGPQRWRADVRCPNYGLSDTDALRLTSYLESLPEAPAPGGAP